MKGWCLRIIIVKTLKVDVINIKKKIFIKNRSFSICQTQPIPATSITLQLCGSYSTMTPEGSLSFENLSPKAAECSCCKLSSWIGFWNLQVYLGGTGYLMRVITLDTSHLKSQNAMMMRGWKNACGNNLFKSPSCQRN